MARYEVHVIADENLTEIHDESLFTTDDLLEAKEQAGKLSAGHCYGTAVLDTQNGMIDFGNAQGE